MASEFEQDLQDAQENLRVQRELLLDVLLTILHHFDALPPRVTVIEIEPRDENWGPAISPPVEAALDVAAALVRREVREFLG